MTKYLLDINVLIALIDPIHTHRDIASDWFDKEGHRNWLTCPLVENGVVRIIGKPNYPNPQGSIAAIIDRLRSLTEIGHHQFVPDDLSLLENATFEGPNLRGPNQITDTYLLALAAHHDAALATFDRRIVKDAVRLPNARIHFIGQETSPV
jgi:toxin-antitoxin system PIN domain toxin